MPYKIYRDGKPATFIDANGEEGGPYFSGDENMETGFSNLEAAHNLALMHAGWHWSAIEGLSLKDWVGSAQQRAIHAEDKSLKPAGLGVWTMSVGGASYTIRDVSGEEAAA